MQGAAEEFDEKGYLVVPEVLSEVDCRAVDSHVDLLSASSVGTRELLEFGWTQQLARQLRDCPAVRAILGGAETAVQCTYFAKLPTSNWLVAAHQDLSIPVLKRCDEAPVKGWCQKEGAWFCQPPADVLSQLVGVRLHLDDSAEGNGPLRVVPGSHRLGRIASSAVSARRAALGEVTCIVPRRGILALRPLLLHASSKSVVEVPRRVLHFLFGPSELPWGLEWRHAY
jgi:Phytanoyl-CoA dioxygenase (PhyH)